MQWPWGLKRVPALLDLDMPWQLQSLMNSPYTFGLVHARDEGIMALTPMWDNFGADVVASDVIREAERALCIYARRNTQWLDPGRGYNYLRSWSTIA